jgi:LAO/AO transport system kinase
LIETVGVGQSETAVHGMVDFFLLLKISGAGDELQGIKRGIMEMADAIVINKADGDNINKAKLAKTEFSRALHLFPLKKSGWQPQVLTCSATENTGIETIWQTMEDYFSLVQKNQFFDANRQQQSQYWMMETINDQLKGNFYTDPKVTASLEHLKKLVVDHKVSPFTAASELLEMYFKK